MHKTERGCDRGDSCAFKHADRALQQQQEAKKARKAQKSKSADEVPNTGFQGLPVPKSKVRFNMTLIRETQVSLCDQHRLSLVSALRDGSTVLDRVIQCMHIVVADVEFRASELIEMIAKIIQSVVFLNQ
jgi:hypothetical protein